MFQTLTVFETYWNQQPKQHICFAFLDLIKWLDFEFLKHNVIFLGIFLEEQVLALKDVWSLWSQGWMFFFLLSNQFLLDLHLGLLQISRCHVMREYSHATFLPDMPTWWIRSASVFYPSSFLSVWLWWTPHFCLTFLELLHSSFFQKLSNTWNDWLVLTDCVYFMIIFFLKHCSNFWWLFQNFKTRELIDSLYQLSFQVCFTW